jgi:hypothetical protein
MLPNNNENVNLPYTLSIKKEEVLYQYTDIKFELTTESGSTTRQLVGYLVSLFVI